MTILLETEDGNAWKDLNVQPFVFRHALVGHPLFEKSRLLKLSERIAHRGLRGQYFHDSENIKTKAELREKLAATIEQMDSGNFWFKLADIHEVDADYEQLMRDMLRDVERLTGTIVPYSRDTGITLFMNSPHVVVPYHFDHETNFLLQIRGIKDVTLFSNSDSVVTLAERENFYGGDTMAGLWREELRDQGKCFRIIPGTGVHHPPLAPHTIRNGETSALSVSIYYSLPYFDARGRVYKANHHLRRLGLSPRPIGGSRVSDGIKSLTVGSLESTRSGLKRVRNFARSLRASP